MNKDYKFDVALSFAGEDRDYVEAVANELKANGINVHYDSFGQVDAWGKDLAEHFDEIYRKQAKYCVMFISEHYAKKVWPNFEKRSALARDVVEIGYILPARFDDTDILGLPPSKAYIDLRKYDPKQFASLIMEKLGKRNSSEQSPESPSFRRPKVSRSFDPYKESQTWMEYLTKELEKRCESSGISFTSFDREGKRCLRFVVNGKAVYAINIQVGGLSRDHGLSFSYARGEMGMSSGYNAWGDFEWNKDSEQVIFKLNDFSVYSNSKLDYTKAELIEYLWGKVCDAAEGKY